MKRLICILISIIICIPYFSAFAIEETVRPEKREWDVYAVEEINGIPMEYAIYNADAEKTILLLPHNGGDMHSFDGDVLPYLQQDYRVIVMSPRGTGKTGRGEGKLTFELMSDDINALLERLKISSVYIFGFSDGGNTGIVFTLRYPEKVSRLAVMGANINTFGTKPFTQLGIFFEYLFLRVKSFITGDPSDAVKADIQGLMVGQPALRYKDLSKIDIPVLNIFGQWDMIRRMHSKRITKSIPNCEELMVIGGEHSSCFDYTDTVIAPKLLEFFSD